MKWIHERKLAAKFGQSVIQQFKTLILVIILFDMVGGGLIIEEGGSFTFCVPKSAGLLENEAQ